MILDIVTGLGNTFRSQSPVNAADGLAVAINASVCNVQLSAGSFLRRTRAKDCRRHVDASYVGYINSYEDNRRQYQKAPDNNCSEGHLHDMSPGL
jgi:hypothetical protein